MNYITNMSFDCDIFKKRKIIKCLKEETAPKIQSVTQIFPDSYSMQYVDFFQFKKCSVNTKCLNILQ